MSDINCNSELEFNKLKENFEKKLIVLNDDFDDINQIAESLNKFLTKEKEDVEKIKKLAIKYETISSDIIKLNVGGTYFSTLKSTLEKKIKKKDKDEFYDAHLLQSLISGMIKINYDENKAIFIDRNPKHFGYILDYLRTFDSNKQFKLPNLNNESMAELIDEAEYYELQSLIDLIEDSKEVHFDSGILKTNEEKEKLLKLCEFDSKSKWTRLYRGTEDGFRSTDFHDKCDNKINILTIVKSTDGYIFGGFTNVAWDQSGNYKYDQNAFLFILTYPGYNPIKVYCSNPSNAIYCYYNNGPTFGAGNDLFISANANSGRLSRFHLNHSYKNKIFLKSNYFAGQENFQVSQIEVFQKI